MERVRKIRIFLLENPLCCSAYLLQTLGLLLENWQVLLKKTGFLHFLRHLLLAKILEKLNIATCRARDYDSVEYVDTIAYLFLALSEKILVLIWKRLLYFRLPLSVQRQTCES